jgi:hypothetical protein
MLSPDNPFQIAGFGKIDVLYAAPPEIAGAK